MHLLKYVPNKLALTAFRNRQELIKAGLTSRRDLLKLGLLTSARYLVAKKGLSSRADAQTILSHQGGCNSPQTREFIEAMPTPPGKQSVAALNPAPRMNASDRPNRMNISPRTAGSRQTFVTPTSHVNFARKPAHSAPVSGRRSRPGSPARASPPTARC